MKQPRVIVSLTMIRGREHVARHVVQSVLEQTYSPSRVIVNISAKRYLLDAGFDEIPPWPSDLMTDERFEFRWVENLGPYRKMLPLINDLGGDELLVTVDDDVLYGQDWLASMIDTHVKFPDAIVCSVGRRPENNLMGRRMSYNWWPKVTHVRPDIATVPIGYGGVLYQRRLLSMRFLNDRSFLTVAPYTDDLWFKAAHFLAETPVVCAPHAASAAFPVRLVRGLSNENNKAIARFAASKARLVMDQLAGYMGWSRSGNESAIRNIRAHVSNSYKVRRVVF